MRYSVLPTLLLCVFCLPARRASAQGADTVTLNTETYIYSPKNFSIAGITDGRSDTTIIGKYGQSKIVMRGGVAASLSRLVSNITQDRSQTAMTITVSDLKFTIQKKGDEWLTEATAAFTFYASGTKIVEFTNGGRAETGEYPASYISSFTQQSFEQCLKDFDKWWSEHKGSIPLSSSVKADVTISRDNEEGKIMYSLSRQLQIEDFTGIYPDSDGPEMAQTNSGIGMKVSPEISDGQVVLHITLTPFFTKNQSWFKPEGKVPKVLAHEQAHFDITAMKTCELYNAIKNAPLTREGYIQQLKDLNKQYTDALDAEENDYDNETHHGINTDKQLEWEQKLKSQLNASGCY